jgi:phosphatidate cytidylyltransferase
VGTTVKGPKIWPLISPNKTYSGSVGGLFGSMIVSVVLFYIFTAFPMINTLFIDSEISVFTFIIYGFFASVLSQLGGLFASWLKRKARAKDYSTIFPGHGGFMDRLDGVAFTAFFTLIFVVVMFL